MSITIRDALLRSQLLKVEGHHAIELTDEEGGILGTFLPGKRGNDPHSRIPFTDAEIAEQSKNREGRPLKDILKDLREKHGS